MSHIAAAFDIGKPCLVVEWDPAVGTVAWPGTVVAVRGALIGARGPTAYQVQPDAGGESRWVPAGNVDLPADPRQPATKER